MAVAFTGLSVLGAIVFFKNSDWPVGVLFIGLTAVYVCEFVASLGVHEVVGSAGSAPVRTPTALGALGERALGFFHIATGLWLMYLVYAVTLGATTDIKWPV
jgi:hypothetical protein